MHLHQYVQDHTASPYCDLWKHLLVIGEHCRVIFSSSTGTSQSALTSVSMDDFDSDISDLDLT